MSSQLQEAPWTQPAGKPAAAPETQPDEQQPCSNTSRDHVETNPNPALTQRSALRIPAPVPQAGLFRELDRGWMLHPLKARALETESKARSGDVIPLATGYCSVCRRSAWLSSYMLVQVFISLAPFAHKSMPQAMLSVQTLEITGLVRKERAKRAHPSTNCSLHLAVQPWLLLVLLHIGRKTHKKTEKQECGDSCSLGRFPSTHSVQGTDLAVPYPPCSARAQTWTNTSLSAGPAGRAQHQTRHPMNAGFGRTDRCILKFSLKTLINFIVF